MIYHALNKFVANGTWHSKHPSDTKQFMIILRGMVENPEFNADKMAEYMAEQAGIDTGSDDPMNEAVDYYRAAAWAVQDYLEANR